MRKQEIFTADYFNGHSMLRYPEYRIGLEFSPWLMESLDYFGYLAV